VTFATLFPPAANRGVGIAFTDRFGGVSAPPYDSFNLGRTGTDPDQPRNVLHLGRQIGCARLALCSQVHGTAVAEVTDDYPFVGPGRDLDPILPKVDALVTALTDVALVIRVADCVPVLLADARAGLVAAAHAGRTGLLAGVVRAGLAGLADRGARDIEAWIGPHICAACYEVPRPMAEAAWAQLPATRAISRAGTPAIDLGAGVAAQLAEAGVAVHRLDPCTSCDPSFYSHRRDHGATGRQAGVIWRST